MKRMLVSTIVCLMFSTVSAAQTNPLRSIWPFGKEKVRPVSATQNPFAARAKPGRDRELFKLPSPTKLIDGAQRGTGMVFEKTRDTWRGVHNLSKSLNPFAAKPEKKAPKKSFLGSLIPKRSKSTPPETMSDFMKLDRPGL